MRWRGIAHRANVARVSRPIAEALQDPVDQTTATTAAGISWIQYAQTRVRFMERWPSIWSLALVRTHFDLPRRHLARVGSALDVGATERVHEGTIRAAWPGVDYRSFDLDRSNRHDYHDFAAIDRQFDLVICLEVLEHVPPATSLEIARQCVQACRPGGHVLLSTPNVHTPGMQEEFTHHTAFNHADLAAVAAWSGLEVVDAVRVYHARGFRRVLHATLAQPLHRLLNVDYAESVAVLARRPG